MGQVWEQQSDEPVSAYKRFLIYRSLGPARSVERAYEVYARSRANSRPCAPRVDGAEAPTSGRIRSGTWLANSLRWRWRDRADAWDATMLTQTVPEAMAAIFGSIGELARVTLETLVGRELRPTSWGQLVEAVSTLAGFIAPETVQAAIDSAQFGVARDGAGEHAGPAEDAGDQPA